MYTETFAQFKKHLGERQAARRRRRRLREVHEHPDVFRTLRLVPDLFALERQVRIACDAVKLGHSYLTGKAAQPHEDNEKTSPNCRRALRDS